MFQPGEHEKFVELVKSMNPEIMVEIGVHEGRTAVVMLREVKTLKQYIGVDVPQTYNPGLSLQKKEIPAQPGVQAKGDSRFQVWVKENGSQDLDPQDFPQVDIVFIDGDHSYRMVKGDSLLARSVVKKGGMIIWHDYGNPRAQVTKALDEDRLHGHNIQMIEGTWFAYERII